MSRQSDTVNVTTPSSYLENFREELPIDLVVSFDEDFPQTAFSNRIVFGIELVKPEAMKRIGYNQ